MIVILIISILANVIFLFISGYPLFTRYVKIIKRKYSKQENDNIEIEKLIIKKSLQMAKSNKVIMPTGKQSHFFSELFKLFNYWLKHKSALYNYPKAYLFAGLTDFGIAQNDSSVMNKVAIYFEKYINQNGTPSFIFNKVDQTPFGIAAINLFNYFNNEKYKTMADYIYNELVSRADDQLKLIPYRFFHDKRYLNDTIGMICPFLIRYGTKFQSKEAIVLARSQLEYYTKHGVDKDSFLPAHAIDKVNNIKIGSINWGRGIGWYFIGLSDYLTITGDFSFRNETIRLITTLNKLKTKEKIWTQFPGSSPKFDASTTTMFMYCINSVLPGTYSKNDIFDILSKYLYKGVISSTSGDTYGVNHYSRSFGDSELSQGFLLMLLSTTK